MACLQKFCLISRVIFFVALKTGKVAFIFSIVAVMLKKVAFIIYHKKYIQIENPGGHLAFSNFAAGGGVHVGHIAMMHAY